MDGTKCQRIVFVKVSLIMAFKFKTQTMLPQRGPPPFVFGKHPAQRLKLLRQRVFPNVVAILFKMPSYMFVTNPI